MRGPCAKRQVICIITNNGQSFEGENDCANPQITCPREPGESFEKCKSICQQSGHAEIQALKLAGDLAIGGEAVLTGITYICKPCGSALKNAGVKIVSIKFK